MLTQLINARILTPQGWLKDGSVLIRDGKILEVTNCDLAVIGAQLIDVKGMYVLPGGVEIHAHGGGGRPHITNPTLTSRFRNHPKGEKREYQTPQPTPSGRPLGRQRSHSGALAF